MDIVQQNDQALCIYDYFEYREFIRDFYKSKKMTLEGYSLASLAGLVKTSKTTIKHLIDKKRHIADNSVDAFADALELNAEEKKYFRYLVQFNKTKNYLLKDKLFENLLQIKNQPLEKLILKDSQLILFKNWIYPAIIELSYCKGFQKDPKWIKERLCFKVSIQKVREAILFLDEHNYLGEKSDFFNKKLETSEDVKSHIYKKFCLDQIDLSRHAVIEQDYRDREISNLTISIDEATFQKAKNYIKECQKNIRDLLATSKGSERVIQFNTQLFTIAKVSNNGLDNEESTITIDAINYDG